jgi:hypothetical protein
MPVRSIATAVALTLAPAAQPNVQDWAWGYWVIAGSVDVAATDSESTIADVANRIEPCGYVAFSDVSAKFALFEPGYTVVVIGPFRRESSAELARQRVKPCIADAYVRYGGYAGE